MTHDGQHPYGQGQGQPGTGPQGPAQPGAAQPGPGLYGQAPYGQQPYGQAPYAAAYGAPGGYVPVGELPEPPKAHAWLLWMTIASAVPLLLMSVAVAFVDTDYSRLLDPLGQSEMTDAERALVEQMLSEFTSTTMITSAVVSALIVLGLYTLVYVGLRRHRNWARITGIIFAFIGIVSTVLTVPSLPVVASFGFYSPWVVILTGVLSVVYLVATVWWLVLAFGRDNRVHFELYSRAA